MNQRPAPPAESIEWRRSDGLVDYEAAHDFMERRVADIAAGSAPECVWLLQHPPLYTAGTSADPADLLDPDRFPVHHVGRGGEFTYHGPGQRVAYVMLNLKDRGADIRDFVHRLEQWIILTLAELGVTGERRAGRIGIWVRRAGGDGVPREDKVAALGVRVRRWVTFHGIAINVDPDLDHFSGIVPCGISEHGVTSLRDLGLDVTLEQVDAALKDTFPRAFEDG